MKPTTEILARISQNSLANKEEVFTKLYRYLLRPDIYFVAYKNLYANSGAATKGVNEDTADGFSEAKIDSIIKALADETYQPMPVKRVYIQKKNNRKKLRPLGIPTFTDKLVQEVLRMILEAVYEPIFLDVSHGFRPKRSCHTALKQLRREFNGTRWFVEGDIKGCFDNIDHAVLVGLLNNKIKDARITKLIYKFLKAGYSEKGTYGSRRGWHRPTTAMWQGGASLLHHLIFNAVSLRIISTTVPISGVTTISAVPLIGSARSTACPSSFPARTKEKATSSIRRSGPAPAIRRSCAPPSTGCCPAAMIWRSCWCGCSGRATSSSGASTFPPERRDRSGSQG